MTIKIDKAIEVLAQYPRDEGVDDLNEFLEALKLGIQALKRVKTEREVWETHFGSWLPGETKE